MHFDGWKLGLSPEQVEQALEAVARTGESDDLCTFLLTPQTDRTDHDTELLMQHILGCRSCAVKVVDPPNTT